MLSAMSCALMFELVFADLLMGTGAGAGTEPAAVEEACVVAADEGATSRALDRFAILFLVTGVLVVEKLLYAAIVLFDLRRELG